MTIREAYEASYGVFLAYFANKTADPDTIANRIAWSWRLWMEAFVLDDGTPASPDDIVASDDEWIAEVGAEIMVVAANKSAPVWGDVERCVTAQQPSDDTDFHAVEYHADPDDWSEPPFRIETLPEHVQIIAVYLAAGLSAAQIPLATDLTQADTWQRYGDLIAFLSSLMRAAQPKDRLAPPIPDPPQKPKWHAQKPTEPRGPLSHIHNRPHPWQFIGTTRTLLGAGDDSYAYVTDREGMSAAAPLG